MDGPRLPFALSRPAAVLGALLAACSLALAAAPAVRAADSPATRWPVGGSTLRAAMALATEHWGMAPCGGRVALSWTSLGAATNAQSSWANDVDPYRQPSSNTDCEIALSLQPEWDWPKLCTVVVHEVGHLTGHDHVDDPTDIMYFTYVAPAPECASTPEPVETGAPAAAPAPAAKSAKAAKPRSPAKPVKRPKAQQRRRRAAARHR
jgi:hypothetical protein